jgi:hypothetical protein
VVFQIGIFLLLEGNSGLLCDTQASVVVIIMYEASVFEATADYYPCC